MVERNYFPINHFICSYECHRRLLKWSMSVTWWRKSRENLIILKIFCWKTWVKKYLFEIWKEDKGFFLLLRQLFIKELNFCVLYSFLFIKSNLTVSFSLILTSACWILSITVLYCLNNGWFFLINLDSNLSLSNSSSVLLPTLLPILNNY